MRLLKSWLALALALAQAALVEADQQHYSNSSAYDSGFYGQYPMQVYHTEKTASPRLNVVRPFPACDDGSYFFICPRGRVASSGPVILDAEGGLIWTSDKYLNAYNMRVQEYRGGQYLTFWVGDDQVRGHGEGEYVLLDQSYREVRRVNAGNGLHADLHEFLITDTNTALVSIYEVVFADLSIFGSLEDPAYMWDSLFQEVDLDTGDVLFEWRATDHFELTQSYSAVGGRGSELYPWDWYHINSVEKDSLGNYLVSSRYLHHVAYINGRTGDVLWTLGGIDSSFTDPTDSGALTFAGQHDARWADGHRVITLFDNGADYGTNYANYSRGMRIRLDEYARTATLEAEYIHPLEFISTSQGSMQTLPNGHVLIGYGYNGAYTEFDGNGTVLCDARFQPKSYFDSGDVQSYRAMKQNWTGLPEWDPKLAYYGDALYMSWLGSTNVSSWLLQGSDNLHGPYHNVLLVPKRGFETAIALADAHSLGLYARVVARDASGADVATSAAMNLAEETVKFLAMEAELARAAGGAIFSGALIGLGVFTVVVVCSAIYGQRMVRWILRKDKRAAKSDSDDDDEYSDDEDDEENGRVREKWTLPWRRPQDTGDWSFKALAGELQMRQRRASRKDSLELSDTDVSDDEGQTLMPRIQ